MQLTIIVVNWNTRDLLRECLNSIPTAAADLTYEVIVIDNGSIDGSGEMVADQFPWVRLVENKQNLGFAAANNQAIALSRARHVLLLNSDARLLSGAAHTLVKYLDAHPQVGIVGPQLLNSDLTYQGSWAEFPTLVGELLLLTDLARIAYGPAYPSPPAEQSRKQRMVDWVSGACLMARRAAIDAVGPLDEAYFMYAEETDWCYRMKQNGWSVAFVPEAVAIHASGASSRRVPERRRAQIYRSKWLFMRKHYGGVMAASFKLLVRIASAFKLGVWLSVTLSRNPILRESARSHVASYRYLLAHF